MNMNDAYGKLGPLLVDAIQRYQEDRIRPGSFLTACLTNNLHLAVAIASEENLKHLRDIMLFIDKYVQPNAWGSAERVDGWLKGYWKVHDNV